MHLRKTTALLLLLLVCAGLCLPARAEGQIHPETVIPALKAYFMGSEGDYGSVNPNDNGALSVGILQWHGVRALGLLRRILADSPAAASYLTAALRAEIAAAGTDWSRRTLNAAEKACVSALLASPAGRAGQDAQAWEDLSGYVAVSEAAGMRTDATVFYYSAICNQFGFGGAKTYLRHIRQTLGVGEEVLFYDLEAFHAAVHNTLSYGQPYLASRDRSYRYVAALGWDLTGQAPADPEPEPEPTPEPEPDPPGLQDLPAPGSWSRPGIDFVLERGLLQGVSPTRFAPEGQLSRAMLVTVLYRLAGEPAAPAETGFPDVPPGKWYSAAVAWAAASGLVTGLSPDRFDPGAPVTREQIAALLYRYAAWADPDSPLPTEAGDSLAPFADAETVSAYARAPLAWAAAQGILRGVPGEAGLLLLPKAPATRAQAAVLLMRFLRGAAD